MKRILIAALLLVVTRVAHATISYTVGDSTYSQDFNTLNSIAGTGYTWANDSTLSGWVLFRQPSPGTAITTYDASTGSATAGSFYSFGSAGGGQTGPLTDRALGGIGAGVAYYGTPASGAVAGWMAVGISNNTGLQLVSFDIGYDGEQWRAANTSAQTMVLEYGFGVSFDLVTTWIAPGGGFDFVSPVLTTAGNRDGNAAANRTANLGGTVTGLNWANGDTLWIRWIERNDAGNDHGLAIDNFTFSATVIPEPSIVMLLASGVSLLFVMWRKR